MNDGERRTAEADIGRLLVRYCRAFDDARYNEVVALFAPNATWQRPNTELLHGREQIRAFCSDTSRHMRFRHLTTNILVEVKEEDRAESVSSFILYAGSAPEGGGPAVIAGPRLIGDYRDRLVKSGGEWLIEYRETRYVFDIG